MISTSPVATMLNETVDPTARDVVMVMVFAALTVNDSKDSVKAVNRMNNFLVIFVRFYAAPWRGGVLIIQCSILLLAISLYLH